MSNDDEKKEKPVISFTKTSPYFVSGLENFTNSKGEQLRTGPKIALCRCGLSKNKPYCDGSHNEKGIDGEKQPDRVKDREVRYRGEKISIHDNRGVCSHDRSCVKDLPKVFDKSRKRWIDVDQATPEQIIETIHKCPSGALAYCIGEDRYIGRDREPAIKAAHNGPLEITGGIELRDDSGSTPHIAEHYTLCRCGASKNKPFCDGTHHDIGFVDDEN